MKKPDLKSLKNLVKGKRLYIAAAATVIAAGGAGAAAYNKAVSRINEGLDYSAPLITESRSEVPAEQKKNDVPKNDAKAASDTVNAAKTPESKTVSQPNVMPVIGEIIQPFSFGELVKSETLGVWKTHDGVDIKAEPGTQVKAMNHGEVISVKEDPLWGNCVTIEHANGIQSFYYSLAASLTVKEGDTVESGQVIGSVGDTAQIEIALPSHLHFAVKRNGQWIDPVSFIDPSKNK